MSTTTEDRMTRAARRHAASMRVLDAAIAFKLADEALTDAEQQTDYYAAADDYSSALDALIEAARATEVER